MTRKTIGVNAHLYALLLDRSRAESRPLTALIEEAVVARIRQLGHPDVDGLLRAVRDGRASKTTRRNAL